MRSLAMFAAFALGLGAVSVQASEDEIMERMASADAAAGERIFRQCQACHTVEEGGANRVGPNLYDIVGGAVAAREGFRYSPQLVEFGGEWTLERLDTFLKDPRAAVPGTRMTYRGLAEDADRANIIAYLASFSPEPMTFGN